MKCAKIEKTEIWKNHVEKLEPVCAINTGGAKRAAEKAGQAKARLVLNNAKADLAGRMQCDKGDCRDGFECVKPKGSEVTLRRGSDSMDIEAKLSNPQPDPNPCKRREKQYDVQAIIGFTITAKCKCEEKADENPGLFRLKESGNKREKKSKG